MCRADLKRRQSVSRKHGYRQPGDSGCAKSQHSVDDYKKRSLREMLQRMSTAYRGVRPTVATALVGFYWFAHSAQRRVRTRSFAWASEASVTRCGLWTQGHTQVSRIFVLLWCAGFCVRKRGSTVLTVRVRYIIKAPLVLMGLSN